ncbi:MAG: family protein phosphatase [Solirubrobacteraceae bacterium]|nr:family protein phosphatase [Solirubrobacteraceae bacterium]
MLRAATGHFAHSDTGRSRRENEDAYFARSPVFVVADGMGGAQAGEVASRVAIEAFERALGDVGASSAEQLLAERVQEANVRIHEMSQANQDRAGMGTTITAAYVGDHDVAVAHVGDSRAYRLRGADFQRLTEDHSLVEEMRRRGQLTAQEADEHPQRSIITRALGPEPDVLVDTYSWRGEGGDVYLLCSDGLTSMVPEPRVAEIVRGAASLRDGGRALIDAANAAGGRDNITVVLFALEEVGGPDPALEQPTRVGVTAPSGEQVRAAVAQASPLQASQEAPRAVPPPPSSPPPAAAPRRRLRPIAPAEPQGGPSAGRRRGRRVGIAFAILALVVVPLGLGGYIASQAVYFIGTDSDGFVTMYRGLPYSLPAGLDLFSPNYVSGVPLDSLPPARRKRLVDHTLRSHDDAADLVRELERGRVAS